jgi:hypothetical protein
MKGNIHFSTVKILVPKLTVQLSKYLLSGVLYDNCIYYILELNTNNNLKIGLLYVFFN